MADISISVESNKPQNVMPANSNGTEEKSSLENSKQLVLDTSSSKNINCIDNINISEKGNNESSNMLRKTNDIIDDKSFETDIDSSQLTKTQCEYFVSKLIKGDIECADVNSQEEKVLTKITEKIMKSNYLTASEEMEINTQKFIDLAVQHAEQLKPSLDVAENQTYQHTDSDDSSILSYISKNLINTCSIVNLNEDSNSELSKEQDPKLSNRHQDPELVAFQAMCEALINTKVIDIDNGNLRSKAFDELTNNQGKHENIISCVESMVSKPSTSKSNSGVNSKCKEDIDNISKLKRNHSATLNLSDESSPEYFNKVSQKKNIHQCNKATDNGNSICELNNKKKQKQQFILEQIDDNTRRVEYLDYEPSTSNLKKAVISNNTKKTGNILKHDSPELIISDGSSPEFIYESLHKPCNKSKVNALQSLNTRLKRSNQSNDTKKIKPITVTLSDDEEDFVSAKVQSSKVKNPLSNKKRKIECKQNHVREFKPLYCCVPNGQIHQDMLDFIRKKKKLK